MSSINYLQSFGPARLAVAVVLFTFVVKILYRAYLTPLRKIPGPWYARLTHLVLKYHVITGRRIHYIHSLHHKYGPVVLVAPTEVDVSSLSGFRKIHNFAKPFLKTPWYQSFTFGSGGMFTMIDPKEHSARRKLFSHAMSKSYLRTNWEVEVRKKVDMAVQKIRRDALQGEADIFKWFTYMATDVIGHLSFGEGFDTLETEKTTQYTEDLMHVIKMGGVRSELPTIFAIGSFLRIPLFITPDGRMLEYGTIAVKNAKSQSSAKPTIFRKILAENEKDNSSITDFEVREEAKNLIVAGSDTTGITITYLLYSVMKNPYLQKQLETEVQTLPEEFTSADVEGLKLLNAVIEEALRLFTAAPGGLPRTVSKGGVDIDGYFLPEDITVATQAYTIHRDPTIFAEPESFQPQRWLSEESQKEDFKAANHPFGAGTRTCIGVHLARMEILLACAVFFRNCQGARIALTQTDEGMEMENHFLIMPAGHKCEITMKNGH